MESQNKKSGMDRREMLKGLGLGAAAGALGIFGGSKEAVAQRYSQATQGLPPLKITNVKAISCAPHGIELIVVKVETSEPGLYGLGCSTFRQRARPVISAINDYLHDFALGKDPARIEDIWQTAYVSSYWRNGPVLNNALSGLDQALWDINGKRANMPVYQLLGGKVRFAIPLYAHAGGNTKEEVAESVQKFIGEGYKYVRIQQGGYGGTGIGGNKPDYEAAGFGHKDDNFMNTRQYLKDVPAMFEQVRKVCGDDVELLHDVHERIQPMDAINLVKNVEPYRPFFIEDPFSPENNDWYELLRQQTSVPIAMGELFNNPHEWVGPMSKRYFDYIRIHISQIGGITPAMKVARLGEAFNILTAWHGPGDVSPVGHAANLHIDYAIWNFGIQERHNFSPVLQEIFPGCPTLKEGYMYVNEAPGLGVDINEKLAAKYPIPEKQLNSWTQLRSQDGTPVRP